MSRHFQFEALIRHTAPELFSYAMWLCGDRQLAEDLVQETLLRAWRALDKLRDATAAKHWLMTILRREHARYYERQRPEAMDLQAADFPEHLLVHHDEAPEVEELRRGMFALERDYREPLVLQVLLGYTTSEIASIMEISQGAVLTRLCRARRKLQALLGEERQRQVKQ
ncbi:MAG: sigma-70 family RNA polymerase sigma factor [Gammaproteobacteria bacterium]|nr:sigma-70 family RNA polymerase sigma factor [Gammaproteobacteria bacterium]